MTVPSLGVDSMFCRKIHDEIDQPLWLLLRDPPLRQIGFLTLDTIVTNRLLFNYSDGYKWAMIVFFVPFLLGFATVGNRPAEPG